MLNHLSEWLRLPRRHARSSSAGRSARAASSSWPGAQHLARVPARSRPARLALRARRPPSSRSACCMLAPAEHRARHLPPHRGRRPRAAEAAAGAPLPPARRRRSHGAIDEPYTLTADRGPARALRRQRRLSAAAAARSTARRATFTLDGERARRTSTTASRRGAATTDVGELWSPGYFERRPDARTRARRSSPRPKAGRRSARSRPRRRCAAERERRERLLAAAAARGARRASRAELVLAADQFVITPGGPPRGRRARARRGRRGAHGHRRLSLVHRLGPRHDDQPRGADAARRAATRGGLDPAHLRPVRARRAHPQHVPRRQQRGAVPHGRRDALVLPRARPLPRRRRATAPRSQRSCRSCGTSSSTTSRARASASTSIRTDGLLVQGAEGYQLTWMDAKCDDWVVTPRRGKAVEINALWYNALRLLEGWTREARATRRARPVRRRTPSSAARRSTSASGTRRAGISTTWSRRGPGRRGRHRVPAEPALRHLARPPRARRGALGSGASTSRATKLLTPVGLRSLAPDHPDYKPNYYGDLRARDAAYHQGTVWAWLIGPFVDAWLKVHPEDRAGARRFLDGFVPHLDEACVGSISEVFDAEEPYTPRGCVAQAWSVAEVLRCWVLAHRRAGTRRPKRITVERSKRDRAASSCTRPSCRARSASATSARRPAGSSTGSPPPARPSGRSCPSAPPATATRPTRRPSAFAGNTNLVSPEELVEAGLLDAADLHDPPGFSSDQVDHGKVIAYKRRTAGPGLPSLQSPRARTTASCARLRGRARARVRVARRLRPVRRAQGRPRWREAGPRGRPRSRAARPTPSTRRGATSPTAVEAHEFFQYVFFRQWLELKALRQRARRPHHRRHAHLRRATTRRTCGRSPHLFKLRAGRAPAVVAGVPPDAFSATGQLWGSPLYDWDRMRADGFGWWIERDARDAEARGRGAARPLPRLRRLLGGARGGRDGRARPLGAGAGARALPGDQETRSAGATCRSSPRTSASSRPTCTRCATSSASPACACSSSPSAATPTTRTCRTSTRRTSSPIPARTTTTRSSAGSRTARARARARPSASSAQLPALPRHRRRRDQLGLHPRRPDVGRRHRHRAASGLARPRLRRPHEHAGRAPKATGPGGFAAARSPLRSAGACARRPRSTADCPDRASGSPPPPR